MQDNQKGIPMYELVRFNTRTGISAHHYSTQSTIGR